MIKCDCAAQRHPNELDGDDAITLIENGCFCVAEGIICPVLLKLLHLTRHRYLCQGKAANAGELAVSGLESTSLQFSWTRDEVDSKLKEIMKQIHRICVKIR